MTSSPTSASDRQSARNKGLAWVSALTLGAGAASAVGALAIAATLPSPTTAAGTTVAPAGANVAPPGVTLATLAARTSTNTGDDGSSSQVLAAAQQAAPLRAVQAPTTTVLPPVAATAAS